MIHIYNTATFHLRYCSIKKSPHKHALRTYGSPLMVPSIRREVLREAPSVFSPVIGTVTDDSLQRRWYVMHVRLFVSSRKAIFGEKRCVMNLTLENVTQGSLCRKKHSVTTQISAGCEGNILHALRILLHSANPAA